MFVDFSSAKNLAWFGPKSKFSIECNVKVNIIAMNDVSLWYMNKTLVLL